mgnify:CR=1 FL=1
MRVSAGGEARCGEQEWPKSRETVLVCPTDLFARVSVLLMAQGLSE